MPDLPWEDNLLERKPESDLKDLLKTFVAFANSVRPGHVAVVLIGEKDDGSVQGVTNPDGVQKSVRSICDKIYPPILWRTQVYEREGLCCIRVEIEYDGETPHFGGAAWVRRGSVTQLATEDVFQQLVDYRSSKVRKLAEWVGKPVTVAGDTGAVLEIAYDGIRPPAKRHPRWPTPVEGLLADVNSFWITVQVSNAKQSEPLEKVTLSWNDQKGCPMLLVKP